MVPGPDRQAIIAKALRDALAWEGYKVGAAVAEIVTEAVLDELAKHFPSGTVVICFDEAGTASYAVHGDTRLFFVDDRAPNDRFYEYTTRASLGDIQRLLPDGCDIGSAEDDRHPALTARIIAADGGGAARREDEANERH